ncbi:hypothetical protein FACS1894196_4750 [Clostridia bacterium]|nr:hypothetical protein FACS1894196_4750 [Clostridia bacterium]
MKKLLVLVLVLCLVALPVMALADSTLRAQGVATVTAAPDKAVISVGYSCENVDVRTAQTNNANAITAIVDAVKALGVEEADIATLYVNIHPQYRYTDDTPTLRGYTVEHMLEITVKNLDLVGSVLDAALDAGANQTSGVTYGTTRENELYLQALGLAVENAVAKANALAVASGVWLGALEEVNEGSSSSPYDARYSLKSTQAVMDSSIGSTLRSGDISVVASVELVYGIR